MKIYQNNTVWVAMTGLNSPSSNRKTGPIPQIWIMPSGLHPVVARKSGADSVVCGECPLRPSNGGGCYVTGRELCSVAKHAEKAVTPVDFSTLHLRHPVIRIGAYGDPAAEAVVEFLSAALATYKGTVLGYTQQWRKPWAQVMRPYCMASVYSHSEAAEAAKAGWRYYRIADPVEAPQNASHERLCPNYTSGVACNVCKLCNGSRRASKSIIAHAHGASSNQVIQVIKARSA